MRVIGVEDRQTAHVTRDWVPRDMAFNETETGIIVIASIPNGKQSRRIWGSACEIWLFPDGTYWGRLRNDWIPSGECRDAYLPKLKVDGCELHNSCFLCPENDCISPDSNQSESIDAKGD